MRVLSGIGSEKSMKIFDACKFKKLFAEVKEQEEREDVKKLGIEMATSGKVEELLKVSYKELKEAFNTLKNRVEDVNEISEKLRHIEQGLSGAIRVAGPRRMW